MLLEERFGKLLPQKIDTMERAGGDTEGETRRRLQTSS